MSVVIVTDLRPQATYTSLQAVLLTYTGQITAILVGQKKEFSMGQLTYVKIFGLS